MLDCGKPVKATFLLNSASSSGVNQNCFLILLLISFSFLYGVLGFSLTSYTAFAPLGVKTVCLLSFGNYRSTPLGVWMVCLLRLRTVSEACVFRSTNTLLAKIYHLFLNCQQICHAILVFHCADNGRARWFSFGLSVWNIHQYRHWNTGRYKTYWAAS